MKECEEEENEVLTPLVRILKYQEYCELTLKEYVKDSYIALYKHDGLCWYHEGLIEKAHSIVVELSTDRVIEVDTAAHKLVSVNGEDGKGIEHNVVLNLSDDGERWEGDVLQNKPFGWGVLYDSENRLMFEGFRIGEAYVCYGTLYYSDIQKVEYEGEWFEGKRWGRGILYDRTGNIVNNGGWVRDEQLCKIVMLNEENQLLHNHIIKLVVRDNSCNGREWSVLDLSFMSKLRWFEVGDKCFQYVEEVKLIGMHHLEMVMIGDNCFMKSKDDMPEITYSHHAFYLKNCERLRELKIGCNSFSDYAVCEIESLPSLRVIEMKNKIGESYNFRYASLELKSDSQRMM